ncbi:MAG: L,D-transpeptidase [Hyphomicrobium sp.]
MSFRSLVRPLVLAILAATPLLTAPNAARAQGLIDFLWGGTDEWGGKRQVVDFDPKYSADQVIVSFGDRRLYLITQKGKAISYPIAVPREQSRWEGTTTVSEKKENPSWRPTPDMLRENPKLPTWVPGGHPMNPLGVRAMYLGASTYRIHGTDAPWTIGQAVSKGCIRMYNEDVLDLYPRIPVGMKVTVTWQQFNPQAVASNDDSSSPSPFSYEPSAVAGTSSKGSTRSIRNLPPPPSSLPATAGVTPDNVGAANKMAPPDPSTEDKPAKPTVKAKPKVKKPETVAATTPSTPAAPAAPEAKTPVASTAAPVAATAAATPAPAAAPAKTGTSSAVEAATKAAEAATRAAESARKAADAAKKAAEDARKATSADSNKEPGKEDGAKRAAL